MNLVLCVRSPGRPARGMASNARLGVEFDPQRAGLSVCFDSGVGYDNAVPCLGVEIVRFVDGSSYPAIVECAFVDAEGKKHTFIEKVPVVTVEDLWSDTTYPRPGNAECKIVERLQDASGRHLAKVMIDVCDSLDTYRYDATFLVLESQLTDCPW